MCSAKMTMDHAVHKTARCLLQKTDAAQTGGEDERYAVTNVNPQTRYTDSCTTFLVVAQLMPDTYVASDL